MADEAKSVVAPEAKFSKFEADLKRSGRIAEDEIKRIEDLHVLKSRARNLLSRVAASLDCSPSSMRK